MNSNSYDVDQMQYLNDLEHVRKRAGTYIGDLGKAGLHHLVHEVVDNSLDEALAGHATRIDVVVERDQSLSVVDNGRGIPVAFDQRIGVSALEGVMTKLKYGGKFDDTAYSSSGGLNGMGMKAVNFLSEWCLVQVKRDGFLHEQKYQVGVPTGPVRQIKQTTDTGTKISFLPDASKFEVTMFDHELLRTRLQTAAFLNRGVTVTFQDQRTGFQESYCYEKGIVQWVEHYLLDRSVVHRDIIYLAGQENQIQFEAAFQFHTDPDENLQTFANNIHNEEGGTHATGFRNALSRSLMAFGKRENLFRDLKPQGSDLREGLLGIVSVRLSQPQFDSQHKIKLTSPAVEKVIGSLAGQQLATYWEEHPDVAKSITRKAIVAARSRLQSIEFRKRLHAKNRIGGGLPGKLRDCTSRDRKRCELYLVEGDSAGGSAEGGRIREYQAILPLRGKIINAFKYSAAKVLANEEVQSIIQATGTGIGCDFDLQRLRYHKVIIMSDADVDGSHIRTLLLCFFYRQMPALIEHGHIYVAEPPLFRIRERNHNRYLQTDQDLRSLLMQRGLPKAKLRTRDGRVIEGAALANLIQLIVDETTGNDPAWQLTGLQPTDFGDDVTGESSARFEVLGCTKPIELESLQSLPQVVRTVGEHGIQVTRFKGLGEMNAKELRETTLLPEKRKLRQITIQDAQAANDMFQVLMGVAVEPRRRFIEQNEIDLRMLDI